MKRVAAILFLLVLALGLVALRRPDGVTNPQFWAEDAVVFHQDAYVHGVPSLWRPHVGYLHTAPRLVAWMASALDAKYHPLCYNGAAWLMAAICIASLARARIAGLAYGGWFAAGALALAPHTSHEVFLTLTNVQWVFAPTLAFALVATAPARRNVAIAAGVALLIAATTTPLSAILLPLAAWPLWVRRNEPHAWWLILPIIAGGGLQALALAHAPSEWSGSLVTPSNVLRTLGLRLGLETFAAPWAAAAGGWIRLGTGIGVLAALIGLALRPGATRSARLLLVAAAGGFLFATFVRARDQLPQLETTGFGDRYFYIVRVLLLAGLGWMVWEGGKWLRVTIAPLTILLLISLPSRFMAPAWVDQRWGDYAEAIDRGEAVAVPIHPTSWTYHFPGRAGAGR